MIARVLALALALALFGAEEQALRNGSTILVTGSGSIICKWKKYMSYQSSYAGYRYV